MQIPANVEMLNLGYILVHATAICQDDVTYIILKRIFISYHTIISLITCCTIVSLITCCTIVSLITCCTIVCLITCCTIVSLITCAFL